MHTETPVMTASLAVGGISNNDEREEKVYTNSIPPAIKALLEDLSIIRRVTLTESPQMLPLIAPALIAAEAHICNLWHSQF